MTTLVATSVVRGSQQGDSHGGVYLIDMLNQEVEQVLDWNTMDIDWQGRGWDRGLRGLAFYEGKVFIAASDELFVYDSNFKLINSFKNPYLKHCHEMSVYQGNLFITSTGYDSIIAFDLNSEKFHWAMHIDSDGYQFKASIFDPMSDKGPMMLNKFHINNVHCNEAGMYISGLHTNGLLHFNSQKLYMLATLPQGTHNARPFRDGVLFNDTKANAVRYVSRDASNDLAFAIPQMPEEKVVNGGVDQNAVARIGFGRGLCVLEDDMIVTGASPSTVSLHDLQQGVTAAHIVISNDVRNAIHGLEVFPYR